MTVLCGTDFSDHARAAARVGAAIAHRLGVPLRLAHVGDGDGPPADRLRALGDELHAEIGVEVEPLLERGAPADRLVALAGASGVRLVVVGTLGADKPHRWLVGSVAERVAQASPVPVLVTRDGEALESWAAGDRTLRVLVGVEPTAVSEAALRWARGLSAVGPCELVIARIVWPAEEQRRHDVPPPVPLDHLHPDLEQELLRELREWAGEPSGPDESYAVRPGWGRVDSHLTQLASELQADLLVVGTHQRAGIARLWQGSVSRGVLHGAPTNVACVPP